MGRLPVHHETPQSETRGRRRRPEVRTVDPVQRPVLERCQPPVPDQPADAHAVRIGQFFVRDQDRDHRMVEHAAGIGQLGEQIGQDGNVAQAVAHPAAEQPVAFDLQRERRTLPVLRLRGHHVEVGAHERHAALRTAWVAQDEVAATGGVSDPLDVQTPAAGVRCQLAEHEVRGRVFPRWRKRRRVLQLFADPDHPVQQTQKPARIERPFAEWPRRASRWRGLPPRPRPPHAHARLPLSRSIARVRSSCPRPSVRAVPARTGGLAGDYRSGTGPGQGDGPGKARVLDRHSRGVLNTSGDSLSEPVGRSARPIQGENP